MPEETWRLLDTGYADGPTNMAVDEAILLACSRGTIPCTLRLYAWNPPCLSIGYFQSISAEANLEECRRLGVGCVRRLTGGRAVLHDRELTYSIVIPASHPLASGGIVSSYRRISRGLAAGLLALGAPVQTTPQRAPQPDDAAGIRPIPIEYSRSPACFEATSAFELTVHGRKLVGSAQTRKRGAVLQHGTILMDFDAAKTVAVLGREAQLPVAHPAGSTAPAKSSAEDHLAKLLESRVTSLKEVLGRETRYEEVAPSIVLGFQRALGITLEPGSLTPLEAELADELSQSKYRSESWNLRR